MTSYHFTSNRTFLIPLCVILILTALGAAFLTLSHFFETSMQGTVMTTVASRNMQTAASILFISAGLHLLTLGFHILLNRPLLSSLYSKPVKRLFGAALVFMLLAMILSLLHTHISAVSMNELMQGRFNEAKHIGAPLKSIEIASTVCSYLTGMIILGVLTTGLEVFRSFKGNKNSV